MAAPPGFRLACQWQAAEIWAHGGAPRSNGGGNSIGTPRRALVTERAMLPTTKEHENRPGIVGLSRVLLP